MIVYPMLPIDNWTGWQKPNQVFGIGDDGLFSHSAQAWDDLWEQAQNLARKVGWEGDVREGPFATVLPEDTGGGAPPVIIAWKQDNNGDTFVASPHRLPWLEEWQSVEE